MNGAAEVTRGLVVAGGNGPVPLGLGKEILDQVSRLVAVIGAWLLVRAARGDHAGLVLSQ